jgi:hypothetical protein
MLKQIFATFVFVTATLTSLTTSSAALASDDHGAATITGEHLNLVYVDHTVAGAVADHPVYASPLEKDFGIRLTHRANEQDFQSVFTKGADGLLKGELRTVNAAGSETAALFTVTETLPAEGKIRGTLDGDVFEINITSDGMADNHFINPVYTVTMNSKIYNYKLENGKACIGCSLKISYVVLGMLRVTGKI